jgi:hypothetical protein
MNKQFVVMVDGKQEPTMYTKLRDAAMRVKELKNNHDAYFKHLEV